MFFISRFVSFLGPLFYGEAFRESTSFVPVERLDLFQVGLFVAGGVKNPDEPDLFFPIVQICQNDGDLGFQGDVVEAHFPVRIPFSGGFGCDGNAESFVGFVLLGNLFYQVGFPASVNGYPSHGMEYPVEGKEKPIFFYQESGKSPDREISQFAPYKIPITGVRSHTDDTFV